MSERFVDLGGPSTDILETLAVRQSDSILVPSVNDLRPTRHKRSQRFRFRPQDDRV